LPADYRLGFAYRLSAIGYYTLNTQLPVAPYRHICVDRTVIQIIHQKAKTIALASLLSLSLIAGARLCAGEVTVFAAASLTDSLKEIARDYERQSGDKVIFNFGASSILARQIEEGAPADIFFSADETKMNDLEQKGLILKNARRSLLSNALAIVVAAENGPAISHPKDLVTDKVKKIALADPGAVPAGIYAKEYLEGQKLWSAVAPKIIPTENVRAALAAVESGDVDAGIVYKTDAGISKKVKIAYEVPLMDGPMISYPAAVVRETKQFSRAKKLFDYLASPNAKSVFRKYGFIVVE
jgi:molybdate transport system substrate-binding protein